MCYLMSPCRSFHRFVLCLVTLAGLCWLGLLRAPLASAAGPELTGTGPGPNAVGVPLNTNITAYFDRPLDVSTITTDTFAAHGMFGGLLYGPYSTGSGDTVVTLNPDRELFPGEIVRTALTGGIEDTTGTPLVVLYQWQFTAGPLLNRDTVRLLEDVTVSSVLTDVAYSSVAWADYDSDGYLDILLTGETDGGNRIGQVWRNGSDGTFSQVATGTVQSVSNGAAAWGDYDNDGAPDILLTGHSSSGPVIQLAKNVGDTFNEATGEAITECIPSLSRSAVTWGDYDNNGDLDFLMAGFTGSGRVTQLWRNENGSFTNETWTALPGVVGVYSGTVAWGDYDSDGDLDFLMAGYAGLSALTQLWRNDGGTFAEVTASAMPRVPDVPGLRSGAAAWSDYDGDGELDLLLSGDTGSGPVILLWHNGGNGTLSEVTASAMPGVTDVYSSAVAWGDYDSDGNPDLLLTGHTGHNPVTRLWRNNGNGTFSDVTESVLVNVPAIYHGAVAWGDYDNDGELDLLLTGQTENGRVTKLFRNEEVSIELNIGKWVTPQTDVSYHDIVTYTAVLSNSGTSIAEDTRLTDTLPAEVTFARWLRQSGAVESNDQITWSGTVTPGETITWTWQVTHTGGYGDVVSNTVEYAHPYAGTDSAQAVFVIRDAPSLTITKSVTPSTDVSYRGTVTYTVTLVNGGPVAAASVWLTDTLPAEVAMAWWGEYPPGTTPDGAAFYWNGTVEASKTLVWTWAMTLAGAPWQPVTNTAQYAQVGAGSGQASAALTPVDQAPLARDDATFTDPETAVRVEVLLNDTDPDGDALVIMGVTQGDSGSAITNGAVVTYTPDAGFSGQDGFIYTVADLWGLTDTATVTVGVGEINYWLPSIVKNRS